MVIDIRTFPSGYVLNLMHQLVWEFQAKGHYNDYDHHDHCNIYMPKILEWALIEDIRRNGGLIGLPVDMKRFHGYRILPGYDYGRIIIAHERYAESNDPRMFHSVDVVQSVDLKDKPKSVKC